MDQGLAFSSDSGQRVIRMGRGLCLVAGQEPQVTPEGFKVLVKSGISRNAGGRMDRGHEERSEGP